MKVEAPYNFANVSKLKYSDYNKHQELKMPKSFGKKYIFQNEDKVQ